MSVDKTSVSYMKEYLKYALEFEKYVYIWSRSLNDANSRMKELFAERKQLETARANTIHRLNSLEDTSERNRAKKEREASYYRKKSYKTLAVSLLFAIMFLCGFVCSSLEGTEMKLMMLQNWFESSTPFSLTDVGIIFAGIAIIFFIPSLVYRSRAGNIKKEEEELFSRGSDRRQELMLQAQQTEIENSWKENDQAEIVVSQNQEEIWAALNAAKENLSQIYAEDVLPQKYQNLRAVATLYEYLETGRCNTIQGLGGIYSTYELEQVQLAQLEQMIQMNERLSRIEDNQRYICQELRKANMTLSNISSSLSAIERTNSEIAKNTAISAAANQQTAVATHWMAWRAWANGY